MEEIYAVLGRMFQYWSLQSLLAFVFWGGVFHVGTYLGAFAIDRLAFGPYKNRDGFRSSFRHDALCAFLELINARKALGNIMLLGGVAWLFRNSPKLEVNAYVSGAPVLGFLIYLLVFDFMLYWYHRLSHLNPLWIQHEYHHSATELNPLSDIRIHALSFPFLFFLVVWPVSMVYSLSPMDVLVFNWVANLLSILAHSRWDTGYGWLGRWVLVSPRHHRLHHSLTGDRHSNFGTYFVIWDRLFGTYRESGHAFTLPTGIDNNRFVHGERAALVEYLLVYPRFFSTLFELFRPGKVDNDERLDARRERRNLDSPRFFSGRDAGVRARANALSRVEGSLPGREHTTEIQEVGNQSDSVSL